MQRVVKMFYFFVSNVCNHINNLIELLFILVVFQHAAFYSNVLFKYLFEYFSSEILKLQNIILKLFKYFLKVFEIIGEQFF